MTRRAAPRSLATALFGLALAVFWLSIVLVGPDPEQPEEDLTETHLFTPEQARTARRLVVDVPSRSGWESTQLLWGEGETPRVLLQKSDEAPPLRLEQEGDTLYLRATATAKQQRGLAITEIYLPPQIQWVQGGYLELSRQAPVELTVQAREIKVISTPPKARWHLVSGVTLCPHLEDALPGTLGQLNLLEGRPEQLHIEALRGEVLVSDPFALAEATSLHTGKDVKLSLGQAQQLTQLRWQPLSAERRAAIEAQTSQSPDCAARGQHWQALAADGSQP